MGPYKQNRCLKNRSDVFAMRAYIPHFDGFNYRFYEIGLTLSRIKRNADNGALTFVLTGLPVEIRVNNTAMSRT